MIRGAVFAAMIAGQAAANPVILQAEYDTPVTRYDHGVLGDAVEWGDLVLTLSNDRRVRMRLPETMVYEDTAPRLADVDGVPGDEVIVVETSLTQGARLAVYGANGRMASTPFIGRAHRWLAPVGAADLDGDGAVEIAYVDRPHLAKTLRIWRWQDGALREIAHAPGLTNHQIGWDFIVGGIGNCGQGTEIITANGDWSKIIASRLVNGQIKTRVIGDYTGPDDMRTQLEQCQ